MRPLFFLLTAKIGTFPSNSAEIFENLTALFRC